MLQYDEKQIYEFWLKAWNEDPAILHQITSPDCIVHQQRMDGKRSDDLKGVEALKRIITEGSAFFSHIQMTIEVGPIVEKDYISARWKFSGSYKGGMPGAKADVGKEISFMGIDIFLLKEGKIKEYWVSSDGIYLMKQLAIL
jgi:predicted ester cyclase